jgi:hypothetical protein
VRPARGVIIAATTGYLVGAIGAGALSTPAEPRPAIILDCPMLAEDSAAHVELISYSAAAIVYRCMGRGY